jgi:hypothetical protein
MTHRLAGTWLFVAAVALSFAACSSTGGTGSDGGAGSGDAGPASGDTGGTTDGSAGHDASVIDGLVVTVPPDAAPDVAKADGGGDVASDTVGSLPDGSAADASDAEVGADDAGDAGTDVAAHTDGPSIDATGLCAATPVSATTASTTNVPTGTPPAAATYTGGTIASGTYVLTTVTHYGSQYGGPPQAIYTFDATNHTLRIVETFGGGAYYYLGLAYGNVDARSLQGLVACNSSPFTFPTFNWYYTVSGATLTLTQIGSSDVSVYTKKQ